MSKFTVWIASMSLIFACGNVVARDEVLQTRVAWLSFCPSDPRPVVKAQENRAAVLGGLVAAIGPKLIEGVVDSASEALKVAGQTKVYTTTARSGERIYKISQDADLIVAVNCLLIVRGVFMNTLT